MIEKISEYIVEKMLYADEQIDKDQKDIMLFGVTRILEDIPKFVGIFLICYFLNILKELSIVFIVTICYKTFIGGAHANTNLQCFIVSCIYFILPIMLAKYLSYNLNFFYVICIIVAAFSVYVIVKIAPADTEEIPVINKKKRKKMKLNGGISLIVISIFTILFSKDIAYTKIVVYTIFLINIFTTPLAYKVLKCKLGCESEEFRKFY